MTCDNCTGSGWLLDQPELGPCTCITPERVATLEATAKHLTEDRDKVLEERDGALSVLREASDALVIYLVSIGLSANPVRVASPELERLVDALGD